MVRFGSDQVGEISQNQLTNLILPNGLTNVFTLWLGSNELTSVKLPDGLVKLVALDLSGNRLTTLTLPPEATNLIALSLQDNPLDTLVLPEPLASSTNILSYIEELQTDGVRIYGYPLAINLAATTPSLGGSFGFHLAGPPGAYRVNVSTDFSTWTNLDWVTNTLGSAEFIDLTAGQRTHSFYRVNLEPY